MAPTDAAAPTMLHCSGRLPAAALTAPRPSTGAPAAMKPIAPEVEPRLSAGIWSTTAAAPAANWKLTSVCTMHHTTATCHTCVVQIIANITRPAPRPPVRIQVRRRPKRAAVRSLSRPPSGLAINAKKPPRPTTRLNAAAAPGPAMRVRCSVSSRLGGTTCVMKAPP